MLQSLVKRAGFPRSRVAASCVCSCARLVSVKSTPKVLTLRKGTSVQSIEEKYVKLDPIDHILKRPGMYVGSTTPVEAGDLWVYASTINRMIKLRHVPVVTEYGHAFASKSPILQGQHFMKARAASNAGAGTSIKPTTAAPSCIPGLLKLFDEILVNACDNKARDPSMDRLEVDLVQGSKSNICQIRVRNNGAGIPIEKHATEGVYVPELVMGHLLTGSNFDDAASAAATGGRHGYGAKLTNIFSNKFVVCTSSKALGKTYTQEWASNMKTRHDPTIVADAAIVEDATEVLFQPDLARFGLVHSIDEGTYLLMCRRVIDAAAVLGESVTVVLNGHTLPKLSMKELASLYAPPSLANAPTNEDRLASYSFAGGFVGVRAVASPADTVLPALTAAGIPPGDIPSIMKWIEDYSEPFCVSFVNGMLTSRGGTHVAAVMDALAKKLHPVLAKAAPDITIPLSAVRANMQLCINCQVANPSFDSQSKEQLTSDVPPTWVASAIPDRFVRDIIEKTDIKDAVIDFVRSKSKEDAARSLRRKTSSTEAAIKGIPKLEDANLAGTKHAHECTLIVTEGDSAKALAVAGLSVVGRDKFGVFPLRGKMLNVRDLAAADALENQEISALIKILGMSFDKSYATVPAKDRGLRYGRVLIMADQDVDGSHIKGLIINMFHKFWPQLLKSTDGDASFIQSFTTPLVKARKGKVVKEFFNIGEFNAWQQGSHNSADGASDGENKGKWHIKYYKGLGTSTAEEGKQYFGSFEKHRRSFVWQDAADDAKISMAFAKDKANDRKEWLLQAAADSDIKAAASVHAPPAPLSTALTYQQFIDTELVEFSRADLLRSIPSVLDGLKPSQRKVLFACFKRTRSSAGVGGADLAWLDAPIDSEDAGDVKAVTEDNRSEVKVSQLAGYVAEHTAYHHGEASLLATIVNMAQDFVGTNNIPLLSPLGQFGTRLQGGKDAASARYIFTKLAPIARHIYPSADDALLKQREDDGMLVEPIVFLPIIPMVLINGAQGIGTGWSTFVPPHNPLDVIDGLSRAIASNADAAAAQTSSIKPWWRNFTGSASFAGEGVTTRGKATWISETDVTSNNKKRKRKTADADVGSAGTRFIRISELPIGRWTDDYKAYLLGLVEKGLVDEVKEYHTESTVDFVLALTLQGMQEADKHPDSLESFLKLTTAISLRNMHLFSEKGSIQKYPSAASILQAFLPARRELYAARLHRLSVQLSFELLKQRSRLRFLEEVNAGKLRLQDHSRTELVHMLATSNFPAFDSAALCTAPTTPPIATKHITQLINWEALRHDKITMKTGEKAPGNLNIETAVASTGFDYLLNTPLVRLTNDSMTKTKASVEHLSARQTQLAQLSASDLWIRDLKALRCILEADPTYARV